MLALAVTDFGGSSRRTGTCNHRRSVGQILWGRGLRSIKQRWRSLSEELEIGIYIQVISATYIHAIHIHVFYYVDLFFCIINKKE